MIAANWHPASSQLRQFAIAALVASCTAGIALRWRFGWEVGSYAIWGVGGTIFVFGVLSPTSVRPVYRLLQGATVPIGWAVSHVFLRTIFYGILTPMGFLLRAIRGRDPLRMKKPEGNTYYVDRQETRDLASYYRQA